MELDMTKGNPTRLLLQFMVPLIIGNVFQQLYSMVDTIIVGRYVGVGALAAVGATGTIMFLIIGFMQGLTTGFTVLTAQRFGAGDKEGLRVSVGNASILSVIITVIMTIVSVAGMDFLLTLMNTPADIYDMSREYIVIICLGLGCNILYNLLSSFLRAVGNSKVPLYALVVAALLNIFLDILFVVTFQMGVAGAAIATVISQLVGGLICLIFIMKKVPIMALERRHWRLDNCCVRNQLGIGIPMALQFSITAVGTIMVQAALNLFGSVAVAAYTTACKVEQLVTQPYMALGMTMATFSAQNRGVNDITRIRKGTRIANWFSVVYSVVIYGVIILALPFVIRLFVGEEIASVLPYARIYIYLCGACFIPLGMIYIFRNVLQGCGYAIAPLMGGVVELGCRAVAAFVAIRLMSFAGVCAANASAWAVTGIYLAIAYVLTVRRMENSVTSRRECVQTADPQ